MSWRADIERRPSNKQTLLRRFEFEAEIHFRRNLSPEDLTEEFSIEEFLGLIPLSPFPCQKRALVLTHFSLDRFVAWGGRILTLPPIDQTPARSAGFQTCRIADFQVGKALGITQFAGLETRDTADLEVCATGAVSNCAPV